MVGFVDPSQDERGRRIIGAIYVEPESQGQGVGGRLMEAALEIHGRDMDIFLEVVNYNQNAINFYKRFGFEQTDAVVAKDEDAPDYVTLLPQIEMVLRAVKVKP